jgi:hypothetical protein
VPAVSQPPQSPHAVAAIPIQNLSAAAAARLRAAGLNPADAAFSTQLGERLSAAAAPARSITWQLGTSPSGDAALRAAQQAVAQHVQNVSQSLRQALSGAAMRGRTLQARGLNSAAALAAGIPLQTTGLLTVPLATAVGTTLSMPNLYALTFNAPAGMSLPQTLNSLGKVHFSVPACQVQADAAASVWQLRSPALATYTAKLPLNVLGNAAAFFLLLDDSSDTAWMMPLGASPHPGTLTFTYAGYVAQYNLTFTEAQLNSELHTLTVGPAPPLLPAANDMGLVAAAFALASPTQTRFNGGATPMQGTDIIGVGVPLGAGYSVTAQVVTAHSVADIGGDSSPDNQYRGAIATIQPGANRFETVIQWHIGPGDSLQYTVQWTFTGPLGQRPLLTMPLRGPCDS